MIKIENVDVFGWEAAIRGMRAPMNSWDKSDSRYEIDETSIVEFRIGENDLKLMKTLSKAGSDHAKFLRMINVTLDITAPLYWWKEYDTYKVGTVANSCSTMHTIHKKLFTLDDFSHEDLITSKSKHGGSLDVLVAVIGELNHCREAYIRAREKGVDADIANSYWHQMIQLLPSSYNQKRTVQLNYQVLKSMYFARRNHKLNEWRDLCDWMLTLPYFKEICVDVVENS